MRALPLLVALALAILIAPLATPAPTPHVCDAPLQRAPCVLAERGPEVGEVTLSWIPPAELDALSYRIYAGPQPHALALVRETTIETGSYTKSGLAPGQAWYFALVSVGPLGERPAQKLMANAPAVPATPYGVVARAIAPGEVALAWELGDDGGSPIHSVRIYRAEGDGLFMLHRTLGRGASSLLDEVASGASYHYVVVTVNALGTSIASDEASVIAR